VVKIKKFIRINERIRVPEVRLIGPEGNQLGVMSIQRALEMANQSELDLVEVAPAANPPVCRITDFSKFKYDQEKKEREAKKHQKQSRIKEIRVKPNIDNHDYQVKLKQVITFLQKNDAGFAPRSKSGAGFTLIEVLITVTIIVILSVVSITLLNPNAYLAKGRDMQRKSQLLTILNAVGQRAADNKGIFETGCAAGAIPAVSAKMATGAGNYDIAPCLVPTYLPNMPYDPKASGAHYTSNSDYDTGYNIIQDATTKRITVNAPAAELEGSISITR